MVFCGVLVGVLDGVGVLVWLTVYEPESSQSMVPLTLQVQLPPGGVICPMLRQFVLSFMEGTLRRTTKFPLMKTSAFWGGSSLFDRFSTSTSPFCKTRKLYWVHSQAWAMVTVAEMSTPTISPAKSKRLSIEVAIIPPPVGNHNESC